MIFFSARQRAARNNAEAVYTATLSASRRPAFYLDFGVPDTLQGRFEMVALHLFAVLHRLMHDPGDDKDLARLVSEVFVDDMDSAFREMGVGDVSVPRRMKTLYGSFAGRISAYETALKEGGPALTEAVSRNVFPDGEADGQAERLAHYLEAAVAALRATPLSGVKRGDLQFPDPSVAMADGEAE